MVTQGKKKQSIIEREIAGIRSMASDFLPRLTNLLNPVVWQSPEQLQAELGKVLVGFAGNRIKKFLEEIWGEKKKKDEEVLNSERTQQSFIDLIKFAAQENPDVEVWEATKKIFKNTLRKDLSEQERGALYDLISICKQLSATEIRIIAGSYQIMSTLEEENKGNRTAGWWAKRVAESIGLYTSEQVLRYEDNLVTQQLIEPREVLNGTKLATWQPTGPGSNGHRLTLLGRKLAELLSE